LVQSYAQSLIRMDTKGGQIANRKECN
jgi:hypothetical protein